MLVTATWCIEIATLDELSFCGDISQSIDEILQRAEDMGGASIDDPDLEWSREATEDFPNYQSALSALFDMTDPQDRQHFAFYPHTEKEGGRSTWQRVTETPCIDPNRGIILSYARIHTY